MTSSKKNPANVVTIAVMRHGNKDGDKLTDLGMRQIKVAVEALVAKGFQFASVTHSPTVRTTQCADIARDVLLASGARQIDYHPDVDGLSFNKPFAQAFGGEMAPFTIELEAIKANGNSVAHALSVSKYAQLARIHLSNYLLGLAKEMNGCGAENKTLCFSHSPFHSLAVPQGQAILIPYDAPEASCIVYKIINGEIADAEMILAPHVE